jgi:hypothetical protein
MPTFPLDTGDDVRDKIDWEGGVWGALCWGLDADDLPEQYRDDWRMMAALYDELDERATAFYERLSPEPDGDPVSNPQPAVTPQQPTGLV